MNRALLAWALLGIPVIFLAGSGMHFMFDLLGRWPPAGVFLAVNESVWEHCKLAFWPATIWALATYFATGEKPPNFFIGTGLGLAIMPIGIVVLFYGYTAILGHHVLWIDILIFGVAVAIGQMTSYFVMQRSPLGTWWEAGGIGLIVLMALLYGLFTFLPPKLPLFKDGPTGTYGIRQSRD